MADAAGPQTADDRLVSIRKSDLDSLEATVETLQNEEVMEQLEESEKDIEKGKINDIEELLSKLD